MVGVFVVQQTGTVENSNLAFAFQSRLKQVFTRPKCLQPGKKDNILPEHPALSGVFLLFQYVK
jgi:hypothetical protein